MRTDLQEEDARAPPPPMGPAFDDLADERPVNGEEGFADGGGGEDDL